MQIHQALMLRRIDPRDTAEVAALFDRHDRTSGLPERLGIRRRELFEFQGVYLHLIAADSDFVPRLYAAREDPAFTEIDAPLSRLLKPYDPARPAFEDSHLRPFYTWSG
ncbi:TcmI family type II polyketide cyclase [Streptomyces sp. NRRL B-1347]|uniref:TcmI family type II polyketide cyclase n=1 Tax=Streptomyces sp. NRRL B-1347 TaxID=1476877 RepID=UPI00099CBC77|nr:TcmI family type II polyketide cyclase [Streptomyces sp. NRRL B-1347]